MDTLNSLKSYLLIAMPNMEDPHFYHGVAYICEHNNEGAMAIMINQPMDITLGEVLRQMNIKSKDEAVNQQPVLLGGPVHPEQGFVIHPEKGHWTSTLQVETGFYITTSQDILEAIAHNKGPEDYLVSLGYAGWGAGQLDDEIKKNYWLHAPASYDIIFKTPLAKRWEAAASKLGFNINHLQNYSGHA